ncbi:hypothetical protein [Desulfoluna spongiiphila]|uniref:Uncharacterized protein n=1 Tax=Desulfoluna spongiiphila TaxID=419481 RepID=A0A1G5I4G8_9BACT|nr:hypothetical protein [Desulfoluna spongiiphila]SCY70992.1 hypothetical protein SAMN05216233_117114 [Desulfoluna spongiiphila]
MPANGALYIQHSTIDLSDVFEDVKSDKGRVKKPTFFDVELGGDVVRFNVMDSDLVPAHVSGLLGYISSRVRDPGDRENICHAIRHTHIVLGLAMDKEFEENPAVWESLFTIADAYDGFVFTYDSLLLPNGAVLLGPLMEDVP